MPQAIQINEPMSKYARCLYVARSTPAARWNHAAGRVCQDVWRSQDCSQWSYWIWLNLLLTLIEFVWSENSRSWVSIWYGKWKIALEAIILVSLGSCKQHLGPGGLPLTYSCLAKHKAWWTQTDQCILRYWLHTIHTFHWRVEIKWNKYKTVMSHNRVIQW